MPTAANTSHFSAWVSRIWHLPDQANWMKPLPAPHRRGVIVAILVILLAFLWPVPSPQHTLYPASKEELLQAELSATTRSEPHGEWRNYTVAPGQTLAQLFRDNNLPVNDAFSMAQVEGDDKPLNTLKAGQTVKVRLNAQGVVTELTLGDANREILFTRQPDGRFIRSQ